ncbi:MAG: glycosyltransferase family 2 protein, partial [Candidatus Binataceae bacterium]
RSLNEKSRRKKNDSVKLSIIIATHARAPALQRLIDSLAPQLDTARHELFVAENGTPAPTPLDPRLTLTHLHEPRPGKCRVQNRAIAAAHGELIACLDDDLMVGANYVTAVENFFDSHPHYAAMKGRIIPAEDPAIKVGALAPYLDLPIVDEGDCVIEVRGVLGANMAFRAAALREVGPFDERLGPGAAGHEEETEMSQRLRRAGFHVGYAPDAVVYHEVDPARASRERFLRIARERGYCRTLHEQHSKWTARADLALAASRLALARIGRAPLARIAREERRVAIARGILDGLR